MFVQTFSQPMHRSPVARVGDSARCDLRVEPLDFQWLVFEKQDIGRQFILLAHGYLGKGNRKVIPSCAVKMIRNQYPSPDNVYMGFGAE